jgi:hypothetical protein
MLSRRGFINTTLGAGAALTAQGARPATAQAPALQPASKRLIVDSQVHLWKAPSWAGPKARRSNQNALHQQ